MLAALAGSLVAWSVGVARLEPERLPGGWPPPSDLAEYTVAVHVHSEYSHDGRGSVEAIAAAAARAGIRVVLLTEHGTLGPLLDGKEGWHGETLILVGIEITTGSGYLLALDPRPGLPLKARGYAVEDLVSRYQEAGSLVLLAHPEHPRLGWRGAVPPVDGLEVIDVFDQVVGAPWPRQLLGLLGYAPNPVMAVLSVVHWPESVLARWDALARERPTLGVLALDAHGGIEVTEEHSLSVPSHETAFRIGAVHVVAQEGLRRTAEDRDRVYRALRAGQFYNAFDGLAPAAGFRFEMRRGARRTPIGGTVTLGEGLTAEIRVPPVRAATVRIRRDGAVIHQGPAREPIHLAVTQPGVYRVEVDILTNLLPLALPRALPWIFSNPIYVRP